MSGPARIAFVCEGDAESADKAFSGSAKSMVDHLRLLDHQVTVLDAKLYHPLRALVAARSFSPNRGTWRARFRYGKEGFRARSSRASRAFASKWERFDLVLQIGATFEPPGRGDIPYALYCDWNMALSIRQRQIAQSAVHHPTLEEATEIDELQRAIYRRAAAIFTISERLRGSFIEDYRIPADRIVTAHAGPNIELAKIPSRPPDRPAGRQPTILFIGKEFRRKGGTSPSMPSACFGTSSRTPAS